MPEDGLHLDEVNDALECFLCADRNLYGAGVCTEDVLELAYYFEEVCAGAVHFVDVSDAGHVVFVGLTPYGLRLGLDAAYGTESGDSAVEDAERALHFDGEIDVSGGVDEVDFIFVTLIRPESGGGGGGDCYTAFLFLFHPVHCSGTVVYLADFVGEAGVEEDALGSSGLTGIDVCHDADVAGIFELFVRFRHCMVSGIYSTKNRLETEVGKSAVGFGHLVHILFALEGTALVVEGVDDFGSEFVGHRLSAALAGVGYEIFH